MWRFLLRELTGQTDTSDQAYMKSKKRKDRLTWEDHRSYALINVNHRLVLPQPMKWRELDQCELMFAPPG